MAKDQAEIPDAGEHTLSLQAKTAVMVACVRVADYRRRGEVPPVCPEPLLEALVGASPDVEHTIGRCIDMFRAQEREEGVPQVSSNVAGRMRFGDDWLMRWLAQLPGSAAQVVDLGAGLNTRPWRLPFSRPGAYQPPGATAGAQQGDGGAPGGANGASHPEKEVSIFEVDQPELSSFKIRKLGECGAQTEGGDGRGACRHPLHARRWVSIAADFREEAWEAKLEAVGYRRDVPTAFIAEGLLYYLEQGVRQRLLATLARVAAPGSALIASSLDAAFGRAKELALADPAFELDASTRQLYGAWVSYLPDDAHGALRGLGWDLHVKKASEAIAEEYGYTTHRNATGTRLAERYEGQCGRPTYFHLYAERLTGQ